MDKCCNFAKIITHLSDFVWAVFTILHVFSIWLVGFSYFRNFALNNASDPLFRFLLELSIFSRFSFKQNTYSFFLLLAHNNQHSIVLYSISTFYRISWSITHLECLKWFQLILPDECNYNCQIDLILMIPHTIFHSKWTWSIESTQQWATTLPTIWV